MYQHKPHRLDIPCEAKDQAAIDFAVAVLRSWSDDYGKHRIYGWTKTGLNGITLFIETDVPVEPGKLPILYARLMEIPGLKFLNTVLT